MVKLTLDDLEQKRRQKKVIDLPRPSSNWEPEDLYYYPRIVKYCGYAFAKTISNLSYYKNLRILDCSIQDGKKGDLCASIVIDRKTLSKVNENTLRVLLKNFPEKFSLVTNKKGEEGYKIAMPMDKKTTVGALEEYFMTSLNGLKPQKGTKGRYMTYESAKNELAKKLDRNPRSIDESVLRMYGYYQSSTGRFYFGSDVETRRTMYQKGKKSPEEREYKS